MSYKLYMLMALLLLSSCAEFQTKIDLMKSEQQLTCSPVDSSLCAGWKV